MEAYIAADKVRQFVLSLRERGMDVYEEDDKVLVLLSDGSYRRFGIIDMPTTEELVAFVMKEEEKVVEICA